MNKLTKEKTAMSLLQACSEEGLTYKEAARIFNTEPAYFKMLEREDKREAIPEKVMDRFHAWVYSGKKLKEYKIPESPDLPTSDPDMIPGPGEIVIGPFKSVAELVNAVDEHEKKSKRKKELAIRRTSKLNDVIKGKMRQMVEKQEADIKAKEKRKYTRKPKENPQETTSPVVYVIPVWRGDAVIKDWLQISPEREMIDNHSILVIANNNGVPEGFVKEIIETTIALDKEQKEEVIPCNPQSEESETDLLKSEIKTLSFLLAREHEANEVLRAENGYLNAQIKYQGSLKDMISEKIKQITDNISEGDENTIQRLLKENDELEDQIRKYLRQGFWARVFNRPAR